MFLGIESMQHPNTILVFNTLFCNEKFDRIIEIGPAWGSLTALFGLYGITNNCEVYSFDINKPWEIDTCRRVRLNQKMLDQLKINFINEDVFSDKTIKKIISLITKPGKCLLLCDGGNKIREFNMFAPYLKLNDMIMGHDYGYDKKSFDNEAKPLSVMELEYIDVEKCIIKQNLEFSYEDIFTKVGWLCMKKSVDGHQENIDSVIWENIKKYSLSNNEKLNELYSLCNSIQHM